LIFFIAFNHYKFYNNNINRNIFDIIIDINFFNNKLILKFVYLNTINYNLKLMIEFLKYFKKYISILDLGQNILNFY